MLFRQSLSSGTKRSEHKRTLTHRHYGTFRFNLPIKFNRFFLVLWQPLLFYLGVLMHRRTHFDSIWTIKICIHWTDGFGTHGSKIIPFLIKTNWIDFELLFLLFVYWSAFDAKMVQFTILREHGKQWRLISDDHCVLIFLIHWESHMKLYNFWNFNDDLFVFERAYSFA